MLDPLSKILNPYTFTRLFIFSDVVSREAISRYCSQHNLVKPKVGEPWTLTSPEEAKQVVFEFGDRGDFWDGESNTFVNQSQINRWKKFLLVSPNGDYRTFFNMTPAERRWLFTAIKETRSSDDFASKLIKNINNHVNYFKNNRYGERLLLLRRLSRVYADDMFMNYAGDQVLRLVGSATQLNFYQKLGLDGLKFNGQPNDYLSQEQIDQERKELGVTNEEFNRFYTLDYGERYLLFESSLFY